MSDKCYLVNNEKFFESLENNEFETAYCGKGGCACGCGGDYKEDEKTKKRVIKQLKKLFNMGEEINISPYLDNGFIVSFEGNTDLEYTKRRVKRIYFSAGELNESYLTEINSSI